MKEDTDVEKIIKKIQKEKEDVLEHKNTEQT
jgi:hypothetical protein